MADVISEIERLLNEFYTEEEKALWWRSPQPILGNVTARELVDSGRGAEVLQKLRSLEEGAYI